MCYRFKATPQFWRSFNALGKAEQNAASEVFLIFRKDPFDARLRTHKINRLSNLRKETVRSVVILGNLRAIFVIHGDTVITIDIGTHDLYKG